MNRTGPVIQSTTKDSTKYDLDKIVVNDVKVGGKSCKSWTAGLWNVQTGKSAPRLDTSMPKKFFFIFLFLKCCPELKPLVDLAV
jgi:hypothetical protein